MNAVIPISIVTPTLNSARFIRAAIENVLSQGIDGLDHIVIDGGSTDGTQDILRQYPHVRWISEPDSSQSQALNKGFRMATAEVVGWLNVDDSYPPGSLRAALDYMTRHPACDIAYGHCQVVRPDGSLITTRYAVPFDDDNLFSPPFQPPAVFFRRCVFDRVGYTDERLHYVMDNQFFIRAAAGSTIHRIPKTLGRFTLAPGSKTSAGMAPFAEESIWAFRELRAQEPWRSTVAAGVWQREFARLHLMAAVGRAEGGDAAAAADNFRAAIDDHDALHAYPALVAEALVVRFEQRQVRDRAQVATIIEQLTADAEERRQLDELAGQQYRQLAFFWANKRHDWPEVFAVGRQALAARDAVLLRRRGFWAIWARAAAAGLMKR